jgi:hypothetical protein
VRGGPAAELGEVGEGGVVVVVRIPAGTGQRTVRVMIVALQIQSVTSYATTETLRTAWDTSARTLPRSSYHHHPAIATHRHQAAGRDLPQRVAGAVGEAGAAEDGGPLAGRGIHAAADAVRGARVHQVLYISDRRQKNVDQCG